MKKKEINYTSPTAKVLVAVTGQVLCGSDPKTSDLSGLRIDVDTENSLDEDDWY